MEKKTFHESSTQIHVLNALFTIIVYIACMARIAITTYPSIYEIDKYYNWSESIEENLSLRSSALWQNVWNFWKQFYVARFSPTLHCVRMAHSRIAILCRIEGKSFVRRVVFGMWAGFIFLLHYNLIKMRMNAI